MSKDGDKALNFLESTSSTNSGLSPWPAPWQATITYALDIY